MKKIFLLFALCFIISACSKLPSPLNNPSISLWGKKCTTDGEWSYVWIHERDKELQAKAENCKD